jgi:hypothetical protein
MSNDPLGYRCSIQFDGKKYVVLCLRGSAPPFTFYQEEVGKKIKVVSNLDKTDLFCYCNSRGKRTTTLTVPPTTAGLIRKNKYPITF